VEDTFFPTAEFINEDHVFGQERLYSGKELEDINASNFRPPYAEATGEYNFYIKEYESLIKGTQIPEAVLPNLYVFASEKRNFDLDTEIGKEPTNPDYFDLVTLGGALPDNAARPEMILKSGKIETKQTLQHQYFDLWARKYFTASPDKINELERKYSNIYFSHSDLSLIRDYGGDFSLFPMGVKIEFSTDRNSSFSELLRETKLFDSFMRDVSEYFVDAEQEQREERATTNRLRTIGSTIKKFVSFYPQENAEDRSLAGNTRLEAQSKNVLTLDITRWWEELQKSFTKRTTLDNSIYLGNTNKQEPGQTTLVGRNPENNFTKSLLLLIFNGKLRDLIKDKMRSYEEIVDGKESYSEVVFYKISKFLVNAGVPETTPVQSFYIPNSAEFDVLEFVDTQVKYGDTRTYKYSIKGYSLVVGSKYRFENPQFPDGSSAPVSTVDVHVRPSLQMVEVDLFERTLGVLDSAPISPNINIIPYRGISNQIKINMEGQTGRHETQPTFLQPATDRQWAREFRKKRGLGKNDPIPYESDDYSGFFEVYRTDTKPTSYADFSNKKIAETSNPLGSANELNTAIAGALEDNIKANTKYWYTFRTIDVHGNISNPSPVYEVEMMDDNGAVIPKIGIYEFEEPDIRAPVKTLKRYLKIEAIEDQHILNADASGLPDFESELGNYNLDGVRLGFSEESIWKKKFKIRITSKATGRKFDLNITFKTNAIKKGSF